MKTASRILALVMVLAMLITACSKRSEQSSAEPPSQADNTNPVTSDVQPETEAPVDFDALVEQYRAEGLHHRVSLSNVYQRQPKWSVRHSADIVKAGPV